MYYPLNFTTKNLEIFPLFGNQLKGSPHVFDFSSKNTNIENYDTEDFNNFQSTVFTELEESGKNWGIGKYLEERSSLLRNYKQIVDEKRVFHVGLDIIAEKETSLYCPIEGTIEMIGKEEGKGNYGGYIILKHEIENCIFYSFYGHLNTNYTVEKNQSLKKGELFAKLGDGEDSGGWFTHTHMQIITQKAFNKKMAFMGYVSAEMLKEIEDLFPSPYHLFRNFS